MTEQGDPMLPAEAQGRREIDKQLTVSGWSVVDRKDLNPFVPSAVREVIMAPGHGRADYALYLDKEIVGVIEAKPAGTPLSGVEWQSAMYAAGLPVGARARLHQGRIPFVFQAKGFETHFTNGYDPQPKGAEVLRLPATGDAGSVDQGRRAELRGCHMCCVIT